MMPPLDSELLRTFLAVAERGNLTHAALVVGRTQSAISMQIKRLEQTVGHSLLRRGPRGVSLTPAGQRLVPQARAVITLLDETAASMRKAEIKGPLRIGIPDEYSRTLLPAALAAFARDYPTTEVSVFCGFAAQQLAALERDDLDMAVIFDVHAADPQEVLGYDPTVWVTSTLHDCHRQSPVPVAVYWNSGWCRDYALRSLEQHAIAYRQAFSCDTASGMVAAVTTGLAIAPLARSTIPSACRALGVMDGFPQIDASRVLLKRNPARSSAAIDALAARLHTVFAPLRSVDPTRT
ncbi:LysR family transcriptional regulator [Xaviernesmea oryzae]|uniref:HTH-type transcriptional regulator TtuA n=1 Tax=Xaviernesmea oryzae TaxID=464029 RepID=A0A1Q9B2G7_9HYPH|nr:LysR family transcriptional regulator [Xaviernesmea oryzae]